MKKLITGLMLVALTGPALAQSNSSAEAPKDSRALKVEVLRRRVADAEKQIARVEARLAEASKQETKERAIHSTVIGGEAALLVSMLTDLIKDRSLLNNTWKLKSLAGVVAAHISYLLLPAERTDGMDEKELKQQRLQLTNTLSQLRNELVALENN